MVIRSGHRVRPGIVCAVTLLALAAPARAQSINFAGGASVDPEQLFGGVAWESSDIAARYRLRPGIDGGVGDGLRLVTINIDLIARFGLGQSGWTLVQGGGPTITIVKPSDPASAGQPRELRAGGAYLFGFAHDSGLFVEFRAGGGGYVPGLKVGVGWSVKVN
jgi:hypothetical protein